MLAGLLSVWTALSPVVAAHAATPTLAQADASIAEIRKLDPALANDLVKLKAEVDSFIPENLPDGAALPNVPADKIAEMDRRAHDCLDRVQILIASKKLKPSVTDKNLSPSFSYILPRLYVIGLLSAPLHLEEISQALGEIERRAAALDTETAGVSPNAPPSVRRPFSERLNSLNAEGTRVWNRLHTAALNIDDLGNKIIEEPLKNGKARTGLSDSGKLELKSNPLQTRVADLSVTLQAIDYRLNGAAAAANAEAATAQSQALQARMNGRLTDPFGKKASAGPAAADGVTGGGGGSRKGGAAEMAALAAAVPRVARAKTLLDIGHVPSPVELDLPEGPQAAVFTGGRGRDSAPKDTKAVNRLRAAGKTLTIGNPERRAEFVYRQEGETCAIAAQVQVLADSGAVPADPKALKAKEDELYQRAIALGYFEGSAGDKKRRFHGGTSGQYGGNLLDMPMRKRAAASEDDLFKAVSTGRMVIVNMKTAALWNTRKFNGGHTVAITGVEISRDSGKPLGYYINDTGTNEGGRFVAVKQFMAAWKPWGSLMIEPL